MVSFFIINNPMKWSLSFLLSQILVVFIVQGSEKIYRNDLFKNEIINFNCAINEEILITNAVLTFPRVPLPDKKHQNTVPVEPINVTKNIKAFCNNKYRCRFLTTDKPFKQYHNALSELYLPNVCNDNKNFIRKIEIKYKCNRVNDDLKHMDDNNIFLISNPAKGNINISCPKRTYIDIMKAKLIHKKQQNHQEIKEFEQVYNLCDGKKTCLVKDYANNVVESYYIVYRCSEPLYTYFVHYKKPNNYNEIKFITNEMGNAVMQCDNYNTHIKINKATWEVDKHCYKDNALDRTEILKNFCDDKALCKFIPASYDNMYSASFKYLNLGGMCQSGIYHKLTIEYSCEHSSSLPKYVKKVDVDQGATKKIECNSGGLIDIYSARWGFDNKCYNAISIELAEKFIEYCQGKTSCELKPDINSDNDRMGLGLFCFDNKLKLELKYACRIHDTKQYSDDDIYNFKVNAIASDNNNDAVVSVPPNHQSIAKAVNISNGSALYINFTLKSSVYIQIGTKIKLAVDAKKHKLNIVTEGNTNTNGTIDTGTERLLVTLNVFSDKLLFNFEQIVKDKVVVTNVTHNTNNFSDNNVKDIVKILANMAPEEFRIYFSDGEKIQAS